MWTNRWTTSGKPGDDRWTTGGNSGAVHIPRGTVHTPSTLPVHKKGAANWENDVFHIIHSPYYYYFPIAREISRASRLTPRLWIAVQSTSDIPGRG